LALNPVSERSNVVVMADEAHRSQYGFVEGGARWMREALPNATFVGFTGTPLERDDKSTIHVFGEHTDVYDIRQAVEDGATRPLYHESRVIKLKVDEEGARVAEEEVEYIINAYRVGEPAEEQYRVPLESLVGAPECIERLAAFTVEHWEKRRAAIEGKAMVVTMSRDIAARLYEAIRALRPDWHDADDARGAMTVAVTGTGDDPEPLRSHVRTKAARKRLAERFKNPEDDLRLVIVCDMWLTGFDCPPPHTMYLDKLRQTPAMSSRSTCGRSTTAWGRTTAGSASARWSMSCRPMLSYTNKAITTAEMIARLIDLAKSLRQAGLSTESSD
jgi:type I restriction enzyme R subunit